MYVCLAYLRNHVAKRINFLFCIFDSGCGSVLLWGVVILDTGFVDDVMFSHNGPYSTSRVLQLWREDCNSETTASILQNFVKR